MIYHQPHNSLGNYAYNLARYEDVRWDFHFHRNFEVIYVESGQVHCTVNGRSGILAAGEFGMCLSNEIHAYRSEGPSVCWVAVFSGDFVHAFEKQCEGKAGEGFRFHCPEETLIYLKATLFSGKNLSLYGLKSCFYGLCDGYLHCVSLTEQQGKSEILMYAITQYIRDNHREKLTLSDVAQRLGYDYYYISKSFQRIFNMSFSDYLNFYRLETACKLLTETDHRISDIALESGFQSIRSFNHFFLTHTGISPGVYRSQNRNQSQHQSWMQTRQYDPDASSPNTI